MREGPKNNWNLKFSRRISTFDEMIKCQKHGNRKGEIPPISGGMVVSLSGYRSCRLVKDVLLINLWYKTRNWYYGFNYTNVGWKNRVLGTCRCASDVDPETKRLFKMFFLY